MRNDDDQWDVEVERRNVVKTIPNTCLDPHISLGRTATNTILQ